DYDAEGFAVEEFGVAFGEGAVGGVHDGPHGGGDEYGVFGDDPGGGVGFGVADGLVDVVEPVWVGPVGDDAEEAGVFLAEFGGGDFGGLPHGVGAAVLGFGAGVAAEDEEYGGAEVGGDAGVVAEFGGGADVGVVAAEDDDDVALFFDCFVAFDDAAEGAVGVVVDFVVADTDGVFVVEVDAVVLEEELEHVVGFG